MQHEGELQVARAVADLQQGVEELVQTLLPVLAPVQGDGHQAATVGRRHRRRRGAGQTLQRVDDRVAGDQYPVRIDPRAPQVLRGAFRWRQMQGGDLADHRPPGLLRKRRVEIEGAQSGLDMHHRNAAGEGGKSRGQGGGCVALDDHQVWLGLGPGLVEGRGKVRQARRQAGGSIRAGQADLRRHAEGVERLLRQGVLLTGKNPHGRRPVGSFKRLVNRRKLNHFRTRSGRETDLHTQPPSAPPVTEPR